MARWTCKWTVDIPRVVADWKDSYMQQLTTAGGLVSSLVVDPRGIALMVRMCHDSLSFLDGVV